MSSKFISVPFEIPWYRHCTLAMKLKHRNNVGSFERQKDQDSENYLHHLMYGFTCWRINMSEFQIYLAETANDRAAVRELFQEFSDSLPMEERSEDFQSELQKFPQPYVLPEGVLIIAKRDEAALSTGGISGSVAGAQIGSSRHPASA
jgi:hypothetical protein